MCELEHLIHIPPLHAYAGQAMDGGELAHGVRQRRMHLLADNLRRPAADGVARAFRDAPHPHCLELLPRHLQHHGRAQDPPRVSTRLVHPRNLPLLMHLQVGIAE